MDTNNVSYEYIDSNNNMICERAKVITYDTSNKLNADKDTNRVKTNYGRIINQNETTYKIYNDDGTTVHAPKQNVVIIPFDNTQPIIGEKVMIDEIKNGKWLDEKVDDKENKLPCLIYVKKTNGDSMKTNIDNVDRCKKNLIFSKGDRVIVNHRNTDKLKRGIVQTTNDCGYIVKFNDNTTEFIPAELVN